jgi:hypothetical protein
MVGMNLHGWGVYRRIQEIMTNAPWSNHDLLVGISLLFVGIVFLLDAEQFQRLRALAYLRDLNYPWGFIFLVIGFFNISVTLWCETPPFFLRLLSRMAGAFCFLTLMLSNIMFSPLIPSTVIYSTIAVWSIWGIFRTKASGR